VQALQKLKNHKQKRSNVTATKNRSEFAALIC